MFNFQNLNGLFNLSPETLSQINQAASVASVPKPAPVPEPVRAPQETVFVNSAMPTAAASSSVNPVEIQTDNSFAIPDVSLSNTDTSSTTVVDPSIAQTEVPESTGMLTGQQQQVTGTNPFGQPSAYYETYVDDYGKERRRPNRAYWDELNKYSGEERRYRELLMRGAIDEEGNIYGGLNPTEIMRGDPPSWATPELIKNAYIRAFESQARAGQNFMDGRDYQNFLNAGYSLTNEQINTLGGVQGQGNQGGLTFGGGQTTTGVANPPPPSPPPSSTSQDSEQQLNSNFIAFLEALGLGSLVSAFRDGTTPDLEGMFGSNVNNNDGGYTPYVPVMPTPGSGEPVDFSTPSLPMNTVGYDPIRGLYNIPNAQTQQTATERTGLFNYIYGPQG